MPSSQSILDIDRLGKVYLVGAGPGGLGHLTLRAKDLLSIADVIVYDSLVDPRLLKYCRDDCLLIEGGKRGGLPSVSQSQINQLLVKHCLVGKKVVRLKSGDPLIFGRISEEIESLNKFRCPFEIIPGISSALIAPLLAGIPLTDVEFSSSFTILTAHQPEKLDWKTFAQLETLIILMGGKSLQQIVKSLLEYGSSPTKPIAIVKNCARSNQEIYLGHLEDIVEKVAQISLSPCIIIIGNVVKGQRLMSNSLPLAGLSILVTRALDGSKIFRELLQEQGARVLEMPALEITAPSSWVELDRVILALEKFDWLIFTSSNGVEYFLDRLFLGGRDIRALSALKIAVVGKKTANYLQSRGIKPDFIPPEFIADALVDHFPEFLSGKNILFPRVESGGRETLVKEMRNQGASVTEVAAYQSISPQDIPEQVVQAIKNRQVDIITFGSSKTVSNCYDLFRKNIQLSLLDGICLASIGPETSKSAQKFFGRVDLEAKEYTLEGLVLAMIEWTKDK